MSQMQVRVTGVDELRRKLGGVKDGIRPMMEAVGEFTRKRAAERARPHPVDKGTLGNTVKFELPGTAVPLQGRVLTSSGIAKTIEEGRRPGKPPPVVAIERWAIAHGIATRAWTLAQVIRRRGTKGVGFMKGAAEDAKRELPRILRDAAQNIERRWGR